MAFSFYSKRKPYQTDYTNPTVAAVQNKTYSSSNPSPNASYQPASLLKTYSSQPAQKTSTPVNGKQYASGMTSEYKENPFTVKSTQKKQTTSQTFTNPYLERIRNLGQERADLQTSQATSTEQRLRDAIAREQASAEKRRSAQQGGFDAYKTLVEGQVKGREAQTAEDIAANEELYGSTLRQGAEANRQSLGQIQNIFAGLGTLDSSAFQNQIINQQSKFAGGQQKTLQEKATAQKQIERGLQEFRDEASFKLIQAENDLKDSLDAIENSSWSSIQEKEAAIEQAYQDAYLNINEIDTALSQIEMDAYQKMQGLNTSGLSQTFLTTGKPETQDDLNFIISNPEGSKAYSSLLGSGGGKKSSAQLQVEGKANAGLAALDTIESQLLSNPDVLAYNALPGSPGARQYEAAVSSLTDAIGGLRTGASVSKEQQAFYRNLLPKVGDSQETKTYKINALRNELSGYLQGSGNMDNSQLSEDQISAILASL